MYVWDKIFIDRFGEQASSSENLISARLASMERVVKSFDPPSTFEI